MDYEALKAAGKLPSPGGVALSIFRLTQKPDVSLSEIGHTVQADPALSGKLIKYANTLKAGSRVIASIPDALNLLGMAATRQISLGFSILNGSRKGECRNFDYPRFWSKCLARAIIVQLLCARTRDARPEECFIGALLGDVGSLALATIHPEGYSEILEEKLLPAAKLARERQEFSADHLELTAALLADWMLPPLFSTIALHQESPETMPFPADSREYRLCMLWHFSDQLAEAFVSGEREVVRRMSGFIREARKIGLEPDEFASVCKQAISSWGEWSGILDVPGSELPDFEGMMASMPKDAPEIHPMRILLAGPDSGELAEFLSSRGHAVIAGEDAEEARLYAMRGEPQVLIGMPGCAALFDTLRGHACCEFAYFLMLSADSGDEAVIRAYESGADDFMVWPANPEVLEARLLAAQRSVKMREALSA